MLPKDKAKELVDKYRTYVRIADYYDLNSSEDEIHIAKQCALICVDEIIEAEHRIWEKVSHIAHYVSYDQTTDYAYWQEVKKEINKL